MQSNKLKEFRKSKLRAGSALIQIMLLSAVFGFVAMAIARLIFMNQNFVNESASRMNIDTLHAQIYAQLLDDQSCFNTFQGIVKSATPAMTQVLDNNVNLASALPNFVLNGLYVNNVTIRSWVIENFVSDGTTVQNPFNSTFNLRIVYSIPFGESSFKEFTRTMLIRTFNPAYPGAWADGVPLSESGVRCISAAPANSTLATAGLNLGENVSKKYGDTKDSDLLIIQNTDATPVPGKLVVNGNLVARGFFQISDQNAKTNVSKLKFDFEDFKKIRGYKFKWIDSQQVDLGFKAQEIRKVYPELVQKDPVSKHYSVNYFNYVPVLLEAIKHLENENSVLEKEISKLEKDQRTL